MRLSLQAFVIFSTFYSAVLFNYPHKMLRGMFPYIDFDSDAEAKQVGLVYVRALGNLVGACGVLSHSVDYEGRAYAIAFYFPLYFSSSVDDVTFPPLVPVWHPVAVTSAVVFALNVAVSMYGDPSGGEVAKWSYCALKFCLGSLFCTESAFVVQHMFPFAVDGTTSLFVGQKLGYSIGAVLAMHGLMAWLQPPAGPIAALSFLTFCCWKQCVADRMNLNGEVIIASIHLAVCLLDAGLLLFVDAPAGDQTDAQQQPAAAEVAAAAAKAAKERVDAPKSMNEGGSGADKKDSKKIA